MVGVLMGNKNAVDTLRYFVQGGEPAEGFFAAQAGVNEEAGALGFEQCGIAGTSGGQDGDSKADGPSRAAAESAACVA
jgi:hypothetical protein